ncbi:hypothetical protein [Micromonospora coerulea]|uniref:hypothetical protein n=1 Tax=Micromonospora coerulea TaxID=47856 RepID=UPI001F1CD297|nr:hypothetical protein [Micromonospora veneta]
MKLRPPSAERNSADGSVPAQTTSGWSAPAGVSCQTRPRVAPVSVGKATGAWSGSCQEAPRSSLVATLGPKCELVMPASSRGVPGEVGQRRVRGTCRR